MIRRMSRMMCDKRRNYNSEAGQTAILSVTIFMVVFAIFVVSFTQVMLSATRNTVNDEKHASARAAADSGVEDAKRILSYCYSHYDPYTSSSSDPCSKVLGKLASASGEVNGQDCNTVIEAAQKNNLLGASGSSDKSANSSAEVDNGRVHVIVASDTSSTPTSAQYYQCLKIATLTETYEGVLSDQDGTSSIIPLRFADKNGNPKAAATIQISWHKTSDDADKAASGIGSVGDGLPPKSTWIGSGNRPAVIRSELVPVANSFTINGLSDESRAVTLRPKVGGNSAINIDTYKASSDPNVATPPLSTASCQNGNSQNYACKIQIKRNGVFDSSNPTWYLRLQSIYRSTHYEIRAKDASGNTLYFDGVQPLVDVTGNTSDAYERVKARLEPSSRDDDSDSTWWPEYVVDTGGKVCKDITVRYEDGTVGSCS